MVAEGCMSGQECADELMKYINIDTRVSVLGHIQREEAHQVLTAY